MDEIKVLQGKLSRAYESVQYLNMQPTKTNMEIVLATMAALKDAYDFLGTINLLEEKPAEATTDVIDAGTPGEPEEEEVAVHVVRDGERDE